MVGLNIPERVDGMGNLTDGELVAKVRQGDQEAFSELTFRYYGLLQWKASGYRKLGIDADDLMQEATLGLLDGVMSFQEGKGASFETYASVCVNNRLLTLYRTAARQKNIPFHSLVDGFPEEVLPETDAGANNPETVMIDRENLQQIKKRIEETLSTLEFQVLSLYLNGLTYAQISKSLSISPKAVDNALQRIRAKLKKTM